MLMADQQLEPDTKWILSHQEGTGRTIEQLTD
jgi:hypothetical protein